MKLARLAPPIVVSFTSAVIFATAHRLTDSVRAWWGDHVQGIVYRSRTTPETSTNLAFFAHASLAGASVPLTTCAELLDRLVLTRRFTTDFAY